MTDVSAVQTWMAVFIAIGGIVTTVLVGAFILHQLNNKRVENLRLEVKDQVKELHARVNDISRDFVRKEDLQTMLGTVTGGIDELSQQMSDLNERLDSINRRIDGLIKG